MAGGAHVDPSESGGWKAYVDPANRRAIIFCLLIAAGPLLYGYDGTYFTSILAENAFKRDYGSLQADGTYMYSSQNQSLWTSIIQAGEFFGSFFAGFIGDWGGRKGAIWAAIALVSLGVLIQAVHAHSITLTIGRLVIGFGVGIISNAVPLYLSEIPPASVRGGMVSSWQLMLAIGQVVGACVGWRSEQISTHWAYRIPMICNFAFVIMIAGSLFIIPESPRWLLYKGREEKAHKALEKVHGHHEHSEPNLEESWTQLNKSRDEELSGGNIESKWSDLILDPVERKKACACIGILLSQQISGVQFIFSYTTTFFQLVGIEDAFTITIVVDCIEVFGVICAFFIVDRFGRRPLLLWSAFAMMICLLIVGCLGAVAGWKDFTQYYADHQTVARCVAAFICLYVFFFNLVWGPLAWAVASEVATGRNRQKMMSVGTMFFWIGAWATTFTLPYLFNQDQAGLGPMIGFIYGFGAFLSIVFVYFKIPETRGRTLEEINLMWLEKVPIRKWKQYAMSPGEVVDANEKGIQSSQHYDFEQGSEDKTKSVHIN